MAQKTAKAPKKVNENYIVGIGASAGGLEALQKLLSALPSNTGFPYIVVQHLSPDYKSLLTEILGKYTEMPVIQVEDGMEVKPDCVYVIQPGKNMQISGGRLLLSAQRERELNLPIDLFFRSLAKEAGAHAIAIILSGTGSDGTNGIKDIKENDGMIIVQDLDTSKFDGMPRSAMRTGLVDAQISPEEIALELQHISIAAGKPAPAFKTEREIDDELLKKVYFVLKKASNVNFTHYKQNTIMRRIERRMMLTHRDKLSDYVDFLCESPEEVKTLSKEVLIGVTSFFRDPEYFQCLKDKVITDILLRSVPEEQIRVWVAGCSTGEEAYSIAILFCEMMDTIKLNRDVKVFATDLDVEAINTAGKGVYSDNIVDSVSPSRLSRYFTRRNNTYIVNREIRKMIVFSPHNVFQDPPFGRLDLISCRNMLIYFQPVLQNDLFAIFHTSLKDGGYLFLGKSEAIGAYTEAFPVVDAAAKIFSHRSNVKIAGAKAVPFLQTTFMSEDYGEVEHPRSAYRAVSSEMGTMEQDVIDNTLLEQFMPACLVVNEKNELVHSYGECDNYIHFAVGKFTSGLYDVITEALKVPVSTLLKEAREKKAKVQYTGVRFAGEREEATINLTAMPVSKHGREAENLYALVFTGVDPRTVIADAVPYEIDRAASQRITDLEQELGEVQGKLNRSVAEQECVNEELQAANEELLTANEELQSSNEELQSVNEELYTVNSEYQSKLTELADLNDDIANFLSSTLIGIIFVDNKLNIRRYTDYVTTEFSVMDHDIGRSLKFISYHFPTVDITEICDNVLKTLVPDEREITTGKNKMFFMRVAPYRTAENKILGCVITLVDVTKQKQGLAELQSTEERLVIAQKAYDAKSDYLLRVSQKLREPMATLVALMQEAKLKLDDRDAAGRCLDDMSTTMSQMASIAADITEASRSRYSIDDDIGRPFLLRDLLQSISAEIRPDVQAAGLTYELSINDDYSPTFVGSFSNLQRIVINFLNYSVQATPRGGEISLKVYPGEEDDVRVTLCFTISDTGVTASKEVINQLLLNADETQAGEGRVVTSGLHLAYSLIKHMGGEVRMESVADRGNTFTVRIPLEKYLYKEPKPLDKPVLSAPRSFDLTGCHALMADDNSMNLAILGAILSSANITYEEAHDGVEAVHMFTERPKNTFDVILMDMRMPVLDGIKATAQIRASGKPDAATIPIISVSANGFVDDIKQAQNAGSNGYIAKPIDRDRLLSAIEQFTNWNAKGKK